VAQGGGRIINIASTAGQTGTLSGPAYCASKAGVLGLSKCLARAFAAHNVLVNAISPALIDIEILYWRMPAQWKDILESIPLKRLGVRTTWQRRRCFERRNYTGATLDRCTWVRAVTK
jgi:NAD(P)-dependent dehydrogenase (short-subunit alcohol dehydrogenase family)